MIRTLRLARRSAMKALTHAANQLGTAPQVLGDRLRVLSLPQLVDAATRCRPGQLAGIEAASKLALKSLAPDTSSSRQRSPRWTPRSNDSPTSRRRS